MIIKVIESFELKSKVRERKKKPLPWCWFNVL